jgi:hypothetical protein
MKRPPVAKARTKTTAKPVSQGVAAYQLKITLREVTPAVWRRVVVPGDIRLGVLHTVFQEVMGWTDTHLHEFVFGPDHYGVKDPDSPDIKSEARVVFGSIAPKEGGAFAYLYDFGDGWEHDVVVEKISPWTLDRKDPHCLDGARACPPEDVGGVGGYEDLVKSMKGSDTKERREFIRWLGREYDPEVFSVKETNEILRWRD